MTYVACLLVVPVVWWLVFDKDKPVMTPMQKARRNYRRAQRDAAERLRRKDWAGVCNAIRRMDRWHLVKDGILIERDKADGRLP